MVLLRLWRNALSSPPCKKSSNFGSTKHARGFFSGVVWPRLYVRPLLLSSQLSYLCVKTHVTSTTLHTRKTDKWYGCVAHRVGVVATGSPVPACSTRFAYCHPVISCLCYWVDVAPPPRDSSDPKRCSQKQLVECDWYSKNTWVVRLYCCCLISCGWRGAPIDGSQPSAFPVFDSERDGSLICC